MESIGVGSSGSTNAAAAAAMPSPSFSADNCKATNYEFDPSISEEEKRFYIKAYPTVDVVRERKTHCTVCKIHIGTAPVQENGIKMHPILRVTHCNKCHDFYNSGEFSKGEDGSELYCRWCGQGGEVYCCSSCPYVFCKSCIVKNLSRGVVADIEQNENWNCFNCAPKILWPLRAQHWALMNYIEQQKKELDALNLSEAELKVNLSKDRSRCCRLAKAKCGNMSDSLESLDSVASKRSQSSSFSSKKPVKHSATPSPLQNAAKRAKSNDEVVCTPDLLSMLEPDCQITVTPKPNRPMGTPSASTPKIMSIQQPQSGFISMTSTPKSSVPPPLVLRNTAIKLRPAAPPPVVRRTIIGPRTPNPGGNGTPVYHTINGYRIDLNSAAQQETFRLPNGKLIQVKRQGPPPPSNSSPSVNNWQQMTSPQTQRVIPQTIASRPVQITQHPYNITVQQQQQVQHPQVVRYHNNMLGTTTIAPVNHNGTTIQVINGQVNSGPHQQPPPTAQQSGPIRPVMVRHVFPDNPIGHARSGLQDQVFNAMEICTHLTNKVQTLTNSNAYKQARNYMEVKELYIHLSYLLTYAIGRFKSLQDKCLGDMRTLGFGNDADSLENGQLAAAVDYVCYGQLDDVDLFNTGTNSFHNQVYEYRKSLHANLKEGDDGAKSPLPPIFSLGERKSDDVVNDDLDGEDSLLEEPKGLKGHWLEGGDDSPIPSNYNQENEENEEPDESYLDNDDDDGFNRSTARSGYDSLMHNTEESMKRNEETFIFDRKLTRLVAQYPSIWCTRHPDYGNFEVTRKQWRVISSHFDSNEPIKLRWKNIRKRFVRIEKRIAEGKRFNGHFDKAMAFLANRDLPEDQWVAVDCGEDDDAPNFERSNLDAIEKSLHLQGKDEFVDRTKDKDETRRPSLGFQPAIKPIEVEPLDLKIITFVKTNPVLWRKSMDHEANKIDEETRRTVWRQLQRSLPILDLSIEQIKDRWQHLYEMYKTFRLKTIKSIEDRSNLELKYSKYLAKLYFLYKIDEDELRNENNGLFVDCFELEDDDEPDTEEIDTDEEPKKEEAPTKLQDMPDDKEFLLELISVIKQYPAIWDTLNEDYNDIMVRDSYWQEIKGKLENFKRDVKTIKLRWQLAKYSYRRYTRENGQMLENSRMEQYYKQASDDEDNEIEIVEPKTDLINLDSDDDDITATSPNKQSQTLAQIKSQSPFAKHITEVKIKAGTSPIPVAQTKAIITPALPPLAVPHVEDNMDLMSMAQSFLASMLEVEIIEGPLNSPGSDSSGQKKQPRKKLTNKPNPTLLKQKALMERERLEEMKRNDQKLKMKCAVELKKAEEVFPYAKEMLEARAKEKLELEELKKTEEEDDEVTSTATVEEDKENENAKIDESTEENSKSKEEDNQSIKSIAEETENDEPGLKAPEAVEASNEISEKDKCIETTTTLDSSDKSLAYEKPDEETKSCNGNDKEIKENLNNSDAEEPIKEKHVVNKETEELLTDTHSNDQKMDIEENHSNSSTNKDNAPPPEAMEVDDSPGEDANKNEAVEIEETKVEAAAAEKIVASPEPEPETTETESNELEAKEAVEENQTNHSNSDMDNEQNEHQPAKNEGNIELTLSQKDEEHAIISNKENSKNVNDDDDDEVDDDEHPQNVKVKDKESPAVMEDLTSKQPATDTLLTTDSTKTSASNGNA